MPNTLVHVAVQSALLGIRGRRPWDWDVPVALAGAVLPDLPWIAQRVARQLVFVTRGFPGPQGDPLLAELRLFFGVQSSLLFCLLLAGAIAPVTSRPRRTVFLLGAGAVLHLVLDALQIKWANGVLLLAPLDWDLVRFDLLWPEHPATLAATAVSAAIGVVLLARVWRHPPESPLLAPARPRSWVATGILLICWLVLPVAFVEPLRSRGAYSLEALSGDEAGVTVELGQASVFERDGVLLARTLTERELELLPEGLQPAPGRVSLRGRLATAADGDTGLRVESTHRHPRGRRESFTFIGLGLIAAVWAIALVRSSRPTPKGMTAPRLP